MTEGVSICFSRQFQAIYVKATKAELAKDWDSAFKLYLSAADDFLHLARTTADDGVKAHAKSRAGVALRRAEKIKSVHRDLTPVVRNAFSEREHIRFTGWDLPHFICQSPSFPS